MKLPCFILNAIVDMDDFPIMGDPRDDHGKGHGHGPPFIIPEPATYVFAILLITVLIIREIKRFFKK